MWLLCVRVPFSIVNRAELYLLLLYKVENFLQLCVPVPGIKVAQLTLEFGHDMRSLVSLSHRPPRYNLFSLLRVYRRTAACPHFILFINSYNDRS